MSQKKSVIEEKFLFYAAMEMRRQGVSNVGEWQDKIDSKLKVTTKTVKTDGEQGTAKSVVFTVDLSGMQVDDKIGIAVAETFIKLHMIEAQLLEVDQWRLILRNNALSDRAMGHLTLITEVCPRLTKLDIRGNKIGEEKQLEMLRSMERSNSVCVPYVDEFTSREFIEAAVRVRQRQRSESLEAGRRSPSAISSSVATSRISFASGGAEALRRRREELFGKKKKKGIDSANAGEGSVSEVELPTDEVVTPREMEEEEPAVVPPPNRRRTVSPSNARHSEPVEPPSPTPHNPSPQDIPRSREPYEEREDFLDVTSNLNPLLDSILDLSGVAEHDGELQHPMIFGGAKRVWEVVGAYESAVEQSGMGSTVDVDTAAKLPSALFSGDVYNALTVLNISNNQLEKIEVLPKSLLRLDISKNKLTSLVGMGQCKMLTVVNARRNEIREISGLEHNRCIAHLFLGRNKIKLVQGLAHLMLLETLDLTYNLLKTQNSIRALSLCPALHHLLLNGNAVVTSMKGRHIPVLRNLCPSLLVVDDVKVSSSRFADALLSQKNSLRQPERIRDSFQPNVPNATLIESRSHIDVHVADRSDMSEESSAPQSANVLHMLTQGVTAVTGYGDGVRVSQGARQMARLAQEKEAEEEKKRRARLTANGKNIRSEIVKQLAEESQRYLENTIVERLMQKTNADVSQLSKSTQEAVKQPAQGKLNLSQQDQELLKHYEPTKFKAPRTRQASQQKRKNTTKSVLSNTKPVEATLDHMYEVPSGEEETPLSYAAQLRKERSAPRQSSSTERKSTSPSHSPPRTLGLRRSESLEPRYTPSEKRPSPLKEATPKEVVPTTTYAPAPLKTVVHRDPALGEWPPAAKHKTEKYSVPPPLQKENRNPIAHADSDQKAKIDLWRRKLQHDSDAVQEALKSLVTLLRAHCPTKMAVPEKSSELPKTYQEERQKCINEISKSGLLEDVTVPLDVVVHYGFKKSELDSETTRKSSGEGPGSGWNSEMSEREDVLRMIRMMGDAKTCLRYTIMLVNDGRERPMQDYVTQVLQHL